MTENSPEYIPYDPRHASGTETDGTPDYQPRHANDDDDWAFE